MTETNLRRRRRHRASLRAGLLTLAIALVPAGCSDDDVVRDDGSAVAAEATAAAAAPAAAGDESADEAATIPDEIYFDLTRFAWYREGRPLVHDGRAYLPMAEPTRVDFRLRESGSYEGVTYYTAEDAPEPVYTIYVPVYYRYWQRFTAQPG